jgi:hypothetical protein
MGTQIEFAQTPQDEIALIEAMESKFHLLSLPFEFTEKEQHVCTPKDCPTSRMFLFCSEYADLVMKNVVPFPDQSSLFHIWPNDGLGIEWDRSILQNEICRYGRLYLSTDSPVDANSLKLLKSIMRFAVKYIQTESPLQSDDTTPVYFGRQLSQAIEQGSIKGVAYRGGKLMRSVPNPHFSPKESEK